MKSHQLLRGSSEGLAAVLQVDTTIGFLMDRQQGIDLAPAGPANSGYVWKRVFLRKAR